MTQEIALYVHWPFCLSKCPYCDFNSHVRDVVPERRFAAALGRELAHEAAAREDWGERRLFRFVDALPAAPATRQDPAEPAHSARTAEPASGAAPVADLVLADRDACCWASAVDRVCGLGTFYGLSLCLRLLALVELMGRARWLAGLFRLHADGAELDPALLAAAAHCPLGRDARFDEAAMRGRLPLALSAPKSDGRETQARAAGVVSTKRSDREPAQAGRSNDRRGALA